jgi:hypothetical protein
MPENPTTPEASQEKLTPQQAWREVVKLRPELQSPDPEQDFNGYELTGLLEYAKHHVPEKGAAFSLPSVERVLSFPDRNPASAKDHKITIKWLADMDRVLSVRYSDDNIFKAAYTERFQQLSKIASRIDISESK